MTSIGFIWVLLNVFQVGQTGLIEEETSRREIVDTATEKLREKWLESRSSEEVYRNFKTSHFLIDVAEDHWAQIVSKAPRTISSLPAAKDIEVSRHRVRISFVNRPFGFEEWIPHFVQYVQNLMDRPFDAFQEIGFLTKIFLPPAAYVLFLLLTFHLWIWAPAICQNLPRWLGSRSRLVVFAALISFYLIVFLTKEWLFGLHLLFVASIVYSRRSRGPLVAAVLTAFILCLAPLSGVAERTAKLFALHEAIESGRTRIEYDTASLYELAPEKLAVWLDFNSDLETAKRVTNALPDSLEKKILEANFQFGNIDNARSLSAYQALRKESGDNRIVLYNLYQLYVRAQELVEADKIRAVMGENAFTEHSRKASLSGRLLLPLTDAPTWSGFVEKLMLRSKERFESYHSQRGVLFYLEMLLPFLLIGLALFKRRTASGICEYTGTPTTNPSIHLSPLYQSTIVRRDSASQPLRNQLDNLIRRHSQIQRKRVTAWGIVLPGAYYLLVERASIVCAAQAYFVVGLFWISLSAVHRTHVLEFFHHDGFRVWGPSTFSGLLFLLFVFFYVFLFVINRRKAYQ